MKNIFVEKVMCERLMDYAINKQNIYPFCLFRRELMMMTKSYGILLVGDTRMLLDWALLSQQDLIVSTWYGIFQLQLIECFFMYGDVCILILKLHNLDRRCHCIMERRERARAQPFNIVHMVSNIILNHAIVFITCI